MSELIQIAYSYWVAVNGSYPAIGVRNPKPVHVIYRLTCFVHFSQALCLAPSVKEWSFSRIQQMGSFYLGAVGRKYTFENIQIFIYTDTPISSGIPIWTLSNPRIYIADPIRGVVAGFFKYATSGMVYL